MRSSDASSAAASEPETLGTKYGHLEWVLGRPHEFAWIRRQAENVQADPAIALYVGSGVVALGFGVLMFFVGRWSGRRDRPDRRRTDD